MTKFTHAESAAELRSQMALYGIKEPLWSGFHWTCKFGPHVRRTSCGTFELQIEAQGRGYRWTLERL
jgi:hypothetical protein